MRRIYTFCFVWQDDLSHQKKELIFNDKKNSNAERVKQTLVFFQKIEENLFVFRRV